MSFTVSCGRMAFGAGDGADSFRDESGEESSSVLPGELPSSVPPPTTGLMMIDLLASSHATKITLYGFDFFASLSVSGRRTAAQVPHNFQAERAYVTALLARDSRFCMANPSALTE
jgi:hypothetical protein